MELILEDSIDRGEVNELIKEVIEDFPFLSDREKRKIELAKKLNLVGAPESAARNLVEVVFKLIEEIVMNTPPAKARETLVKLLEFYKTLTN